MFYWVAQKVRNFLAKTGLSLDWLQSLATKYIIRRLAPDSSDNVLTDKKLMIFFLFFTENWIWHFMHIVSNIGDNVHEMLKPLSWEK